MRTFLICAKCQKRIAGCKLRGVLGASYCVLCKNTSCLSKSVINVIPIRYAINYTKPFHRGYMIGENNFTKALCPECNDKVKETHTGGMK